MLNPHIKLAFRQLKKNKVFSLLNILGLTLGLTTFLLIALYVTDELSYDRWNTKADRIVRTNTDLKLNGTFTAFADAAPPVAGTLRAHYPEEEATVRIYTQKDARFRKDNVALPEPNTAICDPGIFDIFTLPMLEGDAHTALKDPLSVVITESTAQRYFNTTHVLGRTLTRVDEPGVRTITGVIRDLPAQSHFHYDLFLSMHSSGLDANNNYYSLYPISTYVLLKPGTDRKAFDKKLAAFMHTWSKEYAAFEQGGMLMQLNETPLTDIHLHSHRTDEPGVNGNIQYIYIFSAIALFVLLIAGINFMNLSTARSANRAREVGVRKVLGSPRRQLIAQFILESLTLTAVAALIAFLLTWISLPWFNQLTGKQLSLMPTFPWLLPSLLAITVVVGLFSGAYPAFFLSAFRPVQVLKGKLALGGKGSRLRSTLVALQFSISIFLITGTLVILRQLYFIQHRDPGYDRNQVLIIKGTDDLKDPLMLKKEVQDLTGVTRATFSDFLPTNTHRWHNFGNLDNSSQDYQQTELWVVDEDYIPTMGMHLTSGRNFSHDMATDTTAVIINETAARMFGITVSPLNKTIFYPSYFHHPTHFHIIGVVKDFNFTSIRTSVTPLVLVNRAGNVTEGLSSLDIRIAPGHVQDVLTQVKAKWTAYAPQRPFDYSFMDEDFDAIYRAEQRMGRVVIVLTALAIAIACLGLFGLATYAAEQRAKEISIRKVLGASVPSIIALLSKDFARPIALAIAIATPLSWYAMHRWLENFAYRTTIDGWIFVIARHQRPGPSQTAGRGSRLYIYHLPSRIRPGKL